MRPRELDLGCVLVEAEVAAFLAFEFRMPVHIIDGQRFPYAVKMLDFLPAVFDIAFGFLLAEKVCIGFAAVLDSLLCDVVGYFGQPRIFRRIAQDGKLFPKVEVALQLFSIAEVLHLLVECPVVGKPRCTCKLEEPCPLLVIGTQLYPNRPDHHLHLPLQARGSFSLPCRHVSLGARRKTP